MSTLVGFFTIVFMLVAGVIVVVFGAIVLFKALSLIGALVAHILRFIVGMIKDCLRAVGAVVLAVVLSPLIMLNVVIGRWSASAHFGRALKHEIKTMFVSLYRVFIGHPTKLVGLGGAMEGLEQRLPKVIAEAPGPDKPSKKRVGMFDGYTIVGSLAGGGSGGRLYIAEPDELKLAGFSRRGVPDASRVVIKCFSLSDGSSLPQIVRESRALDAAKKLGLVLEHELTDERFFYVMPYVPGESLTVLTTRMHSLSSGEGLSDHYLGTGLGYACDLLRALNTYHRGGLWHKDVKPDNIIVDGQRAHLVDFGLVTPLRSAMTLTTHGTEYFRDPELVRQALRGVKVHQIDGTKFDIYAAGAVLYSVLENSFPAHGGLSQITRRCPDAVKWIVRRAMTDYDKRYASAAEMLTDLEVVLVARDPFRVRPADLPSMSGRAIEAEPELEEAFESVSARAFTPVLPPLPREAVAVASVRRGEESGVRGARPKIRVNHWWSGRYEPGEAAVIAAGIGLNRAASPKPAPVRHMVPASDRATAADQVRSARARAAARRRAAQTQAAAHRGARRSAPSGINGGVVAGLFVAFLIFGAIGLGLVLPRMSHLGGPRVTVSPSEALASIGEVPAVGALGTDMGGEDAAAMLPASLDFSPLAGRRVLVVSELGMPIEPSIKEQTLRVLGGLRDAGALVLGDGAVLLDPLSADDAANVELVASVGAARGQRPLDATNLYLTMRKWLGGRDDVDLIVFLTSSSAGMAGIQYSIVTPGAWTHGQVSDEIGEVLAQSLREAAEGL